MFNRVAAFMADFWYPFLGFVLVTVYLLLLINFFRRRLILVNVLFFLLLIWQIGFGFEIYFRYLYDQTDSFNFLLTSQRWEKRHIEDRNQLTGLDQFRDYRDFRESKPPGELKIAVVGDSIAYGIGVEEPEDRFSNRLEAKLNAAGWPARVYNLARPGDDLAQARANFDKIIAQGDFDLIIWQLFPNDLPVPPSPQTERVKTLLIGQSTNPLLQDLLNRSFAFNFFYFHIWGWSDDSWQKHQNYQIQAFENEVVWPEAQEQIRGMVNDTEKNRVKLIAVLFPYTELLGENYPKNIHQKFAAVFEQERVDFIDLLETYDSYEIQELKANRFDGHPGELGHRLAAEAIFEKVSRLY